MSDTYVCDTLHTRQRSDEFETGVLGSILLESAPSLFACHKYGVSEESFVNPIRRTVFQAIMRVKASGLPIDILSVRNELQRDALGAANADLLNELIDEVPTAAHCEYYAHELAKLGQGRALSDCVGSVYEDMKSGKLTTDEAVSKLRAGMNFALGRERLGLHKITDACDSKLAEWGRAMEGGSVGIPFAALPTVNAYTLGWRRSVMSILAAYRSVGKSTLLRQDAFLNAKAGRQVALLSLEDPLDIVCASMVCFDMGRSMVEYDAGYARELESIKSHWMGLDLPLYICAKPMSIDDIESAVEILHEKHTLDIVYLDHIQYITPYTMRGYSRNDTMAQYSMRLCNLAKKFGIALVCASQFSRDCEKMNRAPRMSDLRDSGSLEQDARQINLLYWHPEERYYCIEVAKNNNGRVGLKQLLIRDGAKHRFVEVESRVVAEERV